MRAWMVGLCAFGLWAAAELPASAAWNNVFQPTLFGRNRRERPVVNNYYAAPAVVAHSAPVVAAPVCNTCQPQQQCSTSYTQRCFYQPVTTYQSQSYYEPVTTYRTSYYYEPVTSYRYSCYYDPCTCSYRQAATPVTSYQLRAQSCPVQSWVQRCCSVPVTTYQKSCYWQPQTTCCTTTQGALIPATGPAVAAPPMVQQSVAPNMGHGMAPGVAAPPNVNANVSPGAPMTPPNVNVAPSITAPPAGPPSVDVQRNYGAGVSNPLYDRYYPPNQPAGSPPAMPPASWKAPASKPTAPPPAVKLESIVLGPDSRVDGQIVRSDSSPKPNAKVMFVSAQTGQRFATVANTAGRFHVTLPTGGWLVYLYGPDDLPNYHSRLDVGAARQPTQLTLVNR